MAKTCRQIPIAMGLGALSLFLIVCLFPLPVGAAEAESGGWGWIETLGRWLNLTLLFVAIYYFTRKPVVRFFTERGSGIREEIESARQAQLAAEKKLAEMEERFQNLDSELEEMRKGAEADAARERERILIQAEEESQKIVESARREIDGLTRAARGELRDYAGRLALDLASQQIRSEMNTSTQDGLVERFLAGLAEEREQ